VTSTESKAHKRRGRAAALIALLLCTVATGVALWWWLSHPQTGLEPDWTANVLTIAGSGIAGSADGPADRARFSDPFGVAIASDGTIYVADAGDAQAIRAISPDGQVFTVAGRGLGFADGIGTAARFNSPSGLAIDAADLLYLADTGNNAIRRVTRDGHVSTLAGDGVPGYRDGPAAHARFNGPIGVAIDAAGRVIVADTYNDRLRAIGPDGTVSTLAAHTAPGAVDGETGQSPFTTPSGVAVDAAGQIYVADTGSGLVRRLDSAGTVTTLGLYAGGLRPIGVAVSPGGEVYITDERGHILEIDNEGATRTIAGSAPGFRDGSGADALFRNPAGVAVTARGRLMVADAGNALVRLITARSLIELRVPASPRIAPAFDAAWFGFRPLLWPVVPMEGPHEIAGTPGEARGGEGTERFHTGIDVRADEGSPVHAVRDGVVTSPISAGGFESLNEWLRIGPVTYVHLRAGRTRRNEPFDAARFVPTYGESGELMALRPKRGARFQTGEMIGSVNAFSHVHLNVGWAGEEYNPLLFGPMHFEDTVPPTIPRGGVRLYDEYGQPLTKRTRGRFRVSGKIRIVVDAWDRADGNRPNRRLGLYSLGYQVLERNGSPAPGFETPRETIRFSRPAGDPDAARFVYAPGSGIPFYGRRVTRFLYIVTNTFRDGTASPGFWDTTLLPPGDYVIRVHATDYRGNTTASSVPVTILAPEL
jgi:DNA-binding beta-propeller fold protein YncE